MAVVDSLLTGYERNLDEVRGAVDFHHVDIRDFDALWRKAMKGIDVVFHEAAIPSVPQLDQRPGALARRQYQRHIQRSACGAKEAGVRRVIYAWRRRQPMADTLVLPKVETMAGGAEIALYAAQKLMGEYYMSVWASCFGIETD